MSRALIRIHVLVRADQLEALRARAHRERTSVSGTVRGLVDADAGSVSVPPRRLEITAASRRFLDAPRPPR